jgi:hypothetical protein
MQKTFDLFGAGETFAHQQSRNTVRAADFGPRNWPVSKLFRRGNDPSTLHRLAYSRENFLTRRGGSIQFGAHTLLIRQDRLTMKKESMMKIGFMLSIGAIAAITAGWANN